MKVALPKFTYLAPKSLKEASALLSEYGERARLVAGGTDVLIKMRHQGLAPDFVISLNRVPGLDYIQGEGKAGVKIGALTRLSSVADHPEIQKYYPALAKSAGVTATVQIRNMGTLVGNICNAAPSADNAAPLLVYNAEVVITHPGGERTLPIDEFFRGPGLTALEPGEIVKEVRLPVSVGLVGSDYQKLSERGHVDIAAVGVSAFIRLHEDKSCAEARIALGAVAPIPMRARRAEKLLEGRALTPELVSEAGVLASEECSPITDVRASAAYRRKMVEVLTVRAVEKSYHSAATKRLECEL
jgi:CO/xanthine dehydrogenase FAD-binding subunit